MPLDKPALTAKDAPDLGAFSWDDPLRLERQLTEDERMLRDAAQEFAQSTLQPRVIDAYREETSCARAVPPDGRSGPVGRDLARGIRGLGRQLRHLRADRARNRARRFGLSQHDVGAVVARDLTRSMPMAAKRSAKNTCPACARAR